MLVLTKQALRYIVDFYIYDVGQRFNQGPFELAGRITFDLNRNDGIGGRNTGMGCQMLVKLSAGTRI